MKHIKSYESTDINQEGFMTNLKKYVVWEMPSAWYIFETAKIFHQKVTFRRLYIYYPTLVSRITGKLGSIDVISNDLFSKFNDEILEHVIYETNDLNELLDEEFLSTLKDINKYNL